MRKQSKINVFTLMMLIIIGLTFQPAISTYAACPDDISSYWKLDDEPTPGTPNSTYVDFIKDNDGRGNANPTAVLAPVGRVNGAQEFDGTTTGIDVPADNSFNWALDESFSIEFWIRRNGIVSEANQVAIGRSAGPTATSLLWWVGIEKDSNVVRFELGDDNGGNIAILTGSTDITNNEWHHVVAVRDSSAGADGQNLLYVDGETDTLLPLDAAYDAGFGSSTADLTIGYLNLSSLFRFRGMLDEVALYNRALTAQEILQHFTDGEAGQDYCLGSDPPPPGDAPFPNDTISLWKLNEDTPVAPGGTYADSFDANAGTGNANPAAVPAPVGRVNGAQEFTGTTNTGIDVPADNSFNWAFDESFSIEFWIKRNGPVSGANQVAIGRREGNSATSLLWWVGIEGTNSNVVRFDLGDDNGGIVATLTGLTDITKNVWHHVVAVRDSSAGADGQNLLYVDGKPDTAAPLDAAYDAGFDSSTADLTIGYLNLSSSFHLSGMIDEVALYDRALEPDEIKDHFEAGNDGKGVQSLRPAPDADAGPNQTDVKETTVVTLNGTGSTAGYDEAPIATYLWEQTGGTPVSDLTGADTATFTAPDFVAGAGPLTFKLTVTADDGQSDSATVDISVVAMIPPVADPGDDQSVTEGDPVVLDGSGSSDADGTIASYSWEQTGGTEVDLIDAASDTATFNAPQVGPTGETLTFQLTVTDNDGLPHSDTMKVSVNDITVPVADAGDDQSVTEGDPVTLDGSGSSDADGTIASYSWEQTGGTEVDLIDAASDTATFAAPQVGSNGETLTFQLTVTDNDGLTNSDSMDVNVVDSLVAVDKIADFVTRFYRLILGREPDSAGLNGWTDDLSSGTSTGCDIAFGFVFSPEFINRNTSDEAYVDILYQAFFNRAADLAGKNGWLNVLQSGAPRGDVLNGFLFSQEFANLAASFGIIACKASPDPRQPLTDFVTRFYRLILDREPDSAGLNGWTDDLSSGTSTGCDIAFGFVFSPEFINRNTTDEAYVDILYQAFFNRAADLSGKNGWLNVLQSGGPRGDVLNGFLFSQEFADLADSFGIIACAGGPV